MSQNHLPSRVLLLMVVILHLVAGLPYGHAGLPDNGEPHSGYVYAADHDELAACHAADHKDPVADSSDCTGRCLGCCAHSACGLIVVSFPLGIPFLGSGPLTWEPFLKESHIPTEPRPPRSLRYRA